MNLLRCWLAVVCLIGAVGAGSAEVYVPPELESWQPWVLHDNKQFDCPLADDGRRCLWPGRLQMAVTESGGQFSQQVEVYAEQFFALPGGRQNWPLDVTVAGKPAAVIEHQNRPVVRLQPGRHTISGSFEWTRTPDTLLIGNGTGLLALNVDGQAIERPRWNQNTLWLRQGQASGAEETQNQINVSVYRLISDGAPATMKVRLQIEIAGESREETVGRLVPEGFTPANMSAPLPSRLDDAGNLKIQARPGSWVFHFDARTPGPLTELVFKPSGEHWPSDEIWSFAATPTLRATEVRGTNAVDPVQAGVPAEWQDAPAYRMASGDELQVIERQRGRAPGESNRLILSRDLWLDFDQGGYTARDHITGTMVSDWRLDMLAPFELQSARQFSSLDGESDLLITAPASGDSTELNAPDIRRGVEIRTPTIDLRSLSRLNSAISELPVSGWESRFERVNTTLFLPPGHRLINAANVDRERSSWVARWNLLDFFLVLIITVAVWRLFSPSVGLVALAALVLSLHEPSAPQWAWLNIVAALGLARHLPDGRAQQLASRYGLLSLLVVVLMLLPFAAQELRAAVFPQLEETGYPLHDQGMFDDELKPASAPAVESDRSVAMVQKRAAPQRGVAATLEEVVVTGSKRNILNRYDKNARVQTGPGVPSWSWHRHQLSWSGPVEVDQTASLLIAPPWMMRLWRVVMVALLALLLGIFAKGALSFQRKAKVSAPAENSGATAAGILLAAMICMTGMVHAPVTQAETPDPAILEELRKRLLTPPECMPQCVDVSRARVHMSSGALRLELIAQAQTASVLKLPGRAGVWMPSDVSVDGSVTQNVRLAANGVLEILLTNGVHRISLNGVLPNANTVVVAFPVVPRHINVEGDGWEVTGVADSRLTGGALTLIRQQDGRERKSLDAIDVEQFPAFVEIRRHLVFDLDWSVQTTVVRRTPPNAAINLSIPLVPGESVTQENLEIKNGVIQLTLPTGQQQLSWTSALDRVPEIVLAAAIGKPWQEHWQIEAGASWRMQHDGVPELNIDRQQDQSWVARFMPWPGESLRISLSRPRAVEGATMAIDSATLRQMTAKRSSNLTLNFDYRATRGNQHAISLPANSELIDVMIDNRAQNLALESGQLRIPVIPGAHHVQVQWRTTNDSVLRTVSDAVDLGIAASNLTTSVSFAANRWVLWTHGPRLGPAVLYWSELLVLIVLAFGLARYGRTPLNFVHWLLLGLGFSTFFWPAFVMVAVALLALAWREKHTEPKRLLFNFTQVVLVILTIIAMIALITTIPYGLLGSPDMHVTGNQSSATFMNWFLDQSDGEMPHGSVFTLPMWMYKGLILIWALWLAFALLRWLPWMWRAFSTNGYWRAKEPKTG